LTLYAIPTPLGAAASEALPAPALAIVSDIGDFVAENAKSARAFLAQAGLQRPLQDVSIRILDEHTPPREVSALLQPLREGRTLGLLSEAGCPAIADPGAALVEAAHREGFRVVPLIGPSSIVLALMASGLEGQRFAFYGYLPREKRAREQKIRDLEQRSRRERETEIFIETPYRNDALLDSAIAACAPTTMLCVAADLTLRTESIVTRSVAAWRQARASVGRRPAIFLLYSS
jgi:16S rRNA (cytidine1402-2'-O)-methyltransferase